MSRYEQALSVARTIPVIVPAFEAVATASDDARERWAEEDRDVRARARRWIMLAAAAWLSRPLLEVVLPDPSWPDPTGLETLVAYVWMVPPVLVLLWAARLSRDRRLRPNILTRAIAASSLGFALVASFSESNSHCVFSILLAVAMGRSLQLLGERGLDGGEDHSSSFEPIRFRGVLILAVVIACADVVTLLRASAGAGSLVAASYFVEDYERWASLMPSLGWTAAAAAIMVVNIWGLLRLRTWALFSNMLANVAIAALALGGALAVGGWFVYALAMTAVIQLLLALPILAAALGLGGARQYAWVGPVLLRVLVPAAVLITIVAAALHLRWSISSPW
jgi:hypothetical protein